MTLFPKVKIRELMIGDRFIYLNTLWTLVARNDKWATTRKHSKHSVALNERGYGYLDTLCSEEVELEVEFVHPLQFPFTTNEIIKKYNKK